MEKLKNKMFKEHTLIFKTFEDFEQREDNSINGVSPDFAEKYPEYEQDNASNVGCWNCRGCTDCRACEVCIDCERCMSCVDCRTCKRCRGCNNCVSCDSCINCDNCSNCRHCNQCMGCGNCEHCTGLDYEHFENKKIVFEQEKKMEEKKYPLGRNAMRKKMLVKHLESTGALTRDKLLEWLYENTPPVGKAADKPNYIIYTLNRYIQLGYVKQEERDGVVYCFIDNNQETLPVNMNEETTEEPMEKEEMITRKDFFLENEGVYYMPDTSGAMHRAEETLEKIQKWGKVYLHVIKTAFENGTVHVRDWKSDGRVDIEKSGDVVSRYPDFKNFFAEFERRVTVQAGYVAKANIPII